MSLFDKVKEVVVRELKIEDPNKVNLDTNLATDLGADSLDAVEVIMALEEEFDMSIDDETAQNIRTIKDLVDYIEANK